MSQDTKQQFVFSSDGGSCSHGRAKVPLDHRVGCFALPPLAVNVVIGTSFEPVMHVPSHRFAGRFLRRSTSFGRDDRSHAHVQPRDAVIRFRIVSGIGNHAVDLSVGPSPRVEEQAIEVGLIAACPGAGDRGEDQVRCGIDRQRELGKSSDDTMTPAVHRPAARSFARCSAPFLRDDLRASALRAESSLRSSK